MVIKYNNENARKYVIVINFDIIDTFHLIVLQKLNEGYDIISIVFDMNSYNLSITFIINKIIRRILKLSRNSNAIFFISGIPLCLFNRAVLRPYLLKDFKNKLLYDNTIIDNTKNKNSIYTLGGISNYVFAKNCHLCRSYDNCKGIPEVYIKKFGYEEFEYMLSNDELFDKNIKKIMSFSNNNIKVLARVVLNDFICDNYYMRKRLVFVNSFPKNIQEASSERFVYYIYNLDEDFGKTLDLVSKIIFENKVIDDDLVFFLKKAQQLVISVALMSDGQIRRTLYFCLENKLDVDKDRLIKYFNLFENIGDDFWGIGIDYKGSSKTMKVYNKKRVADVNFMLDFVKEFEVFSKKEFFNFLDYVRVEDRKFKFHDILYDYKFRNGKLFSKRIDISCQFNKIDFNNFISKYFKEEDLLKSNLYTLSFEFAFKKKCKINVYYSFQ